MISYKPLCHTLIDKSIRKMEFVRITGISNSTLFSLNKYKPVGSRSFRAHLPHSRLSY